MGHQGRRSAGQIVVAGATALLFLFFHFKTIQATTFTVGDTSGWTFSVQSWTDGKNFKAGDILTFNYDPSLHNVAIVDATVYNSCTAPSSSSATYTSGKDRIKLKKGPNYFICSFPSHCDGGLKMAVNASS